MTRSCDYCRSPIVGSSYLGRPWPHRPAASYCCYGCLSLGESDREEPTVPTKSSVRLDGFAIRICIGLLVAGQSMVFGLAINLEEQTPRAVRLGVQGVILAGTLLVVALLGPPLFRNAFAEMRRGRLTIEALFLLTMTGAMLASLQSFVAGRGPIYFEVVTVLLVVYALGKAIGARSRAAAMASTRLWATSLSTCRLLDAQGRDRRAEVASILPGDIVEVRPGETIAVDGVIREGVGFVSESAVNGEPFAVVRRLGDRVLAGMVSHDATFRIEATAPGTARQIDRLISAIEEARARPTSLQAQADRLGRLFFPLIVVTAVVTFAVWTRLSGWEAGLFNAMSVLLVACPCALGLATPIVLWSVLNRLAERGIVARAGDAIERLAQIDCVVFDKTGTLTEDRFTLLDIVTFAEGDERERILGWLALVEEQSQHPIARPFATLARAAGSPHSQRVLSFRFVPGCGVEADIEAGSLSTPRTRRVRVGRPGWIDKSGSVDESTLLAKLHGKTDHRIDMEIDGRLAAIASVRERVRESVPETLTTLQNMGLPVQVLTGDTAERSAFLALPETLGGLLPDDKRRLIEEMKRAGRKPLMIGDGINDASALASAHVGIALASGTDLANSAATATLYHGDLRAIPWAIALSREAVRTVRRNLFRAAGYNVVGIALAACGLLHPVAAALLMVGSSLLVAWSSVRVGVSADFHGECRLSANNASARPRAAIHAFAFILQAFCALLLLTLEPSIAIALCLLAAIFGVSTAYVWSRWTTIPHWLDMAYGMLSLGNLGMLLGWWADNGFTRLQNVGCCECANAMRQGVMKPWMWIGMLAFANGAMALLLRRPNSGPSYCKTAMFTGGNLGMVAGMILGGWMTSGLTADSVPLGALASFAGMTLGMVGGMLIGTESLRRSIEFASRWKDSPPVGGNRTGPIGIKLNGLR